MIPNTKLIAIIHKAQRLMVINSNLNLVLFCFLFSDLRLFLIFLGWVKSVLCSFHSLSFLMIKHCFIILGKLSFQTWHKGCAMKCSPRISPCQNVNSIWEWCYHVLRDIWMIHDWLPVQQVLVIRKYQISDFSYAMSFAVSCGQFSPGEQDLWSVLRLLMMLFSLD